MSADEAKTMILKKIGWKNVGIDPQQLEVVILSPIMDI